jgi:outer membrane protein assembly factor BamC
VNHSSKFILLALGLLITGCSSLQSDKVDYKSSSKAPVVSLEVPPDLSQLSRDTRYNPTGSVVTASGFQVGQAANSPSASKTAAAAIGDVRIERVGNQRWLVVDRTADKLWDPIKEFWKENGLALVVDQPNLGIMETDWAENRAKIDQGAIRNTLGRLLNSFYSTGERDKYRTRLERNGQSTEIYISHRGMIEVYTSSLRDNAVWQPKPADPELETEFLRRLMVKLGISQEQSRILVASNAPRLNSRLATVDGQVVVQVNETFDRAWRRVGLSLDRTGFTVEDRDRSKGIYFVRYVEPTTQKTQPGFFTKLFSGAPKSNSPQQYRIFIKGEGSESVVSVQNSSGLNEASENAQRILKVLSDDMK